MIWTEVQKTEMQKMRDLGYSNDDIAHNFGVTAKRPGDVIRKVLLRFQKRTGVELVETAQAIKGCSVSRPQWAGRPPLRIMPKDFQR